jgi:NAD(P)-dependent dehydrogenase (short-subunit alcohol dehydrogenase family)
MELLILTGASRGLGRALAAQLLSPERRLLAISRHPDPSLDAQARAAGAPLEQWALDLAHDIGVAARLEAWLHLHGSGGWTRATLINNAGILGTVGPVDVGDGAMLASVLRVNLEAPCLLTSAFLRATAAWPAERRVLHISSGAGRRAIAGWAAYCAAKAGLDHFARVTALDEAGRPRPARIVSLAPGVIDTDMQTELRAADPVGFPEHANFRALKADGRLANPAAAARSVLAFLARPDFGTHPVADVRDA